MTEIEIKEAKIIPIWPTDESMEECAGMFTLLESGSLNAMKPFTIRIVQFETIKNVYVEVNGNMSQLTDIGVYKTIREYEYNADEIVKYIKQYALSPGLMFSVQNEPRSINADINKIFEALGDSKASAVRDILAESGRVTVCYDISDENLA